MKNYCFLFILLLIACTPKNEAIQKTTAKTTSEKLPDLEVERIMVRDQFSWMSYYMAVQPKDRKIDHVLVLLHGYTQKAENLFQETKLEEEAYNNNTLTVAMAVGQKLYADSTVISNLNILLEDIIQRYNVQPDQFVLGGFSAGGVIALRYTELCKENPDQYPIRPKAIFAVDAPIDLFGTWDYFEREIERNYSEVGMNEAKFVMKVATKEHGTPTNNRDKYLHLTPFYSKMKEPGNERFLVNTPVRMYHDIDVEWVLENRQRSIFDTNYLYTSELIARLMRQGNDKAEFIQSTKKGYRSNGKRHPHSWSIIDEVECMEWIKSL